MFGLGLRTVHYQDLLQHAYPIDWLEILSENYLVPGGRPLYYLDQFAERFPIVMHGVSMNIGSTDPLDFGYLKQLKQLMHRVKARWVSDHFCWTGIQKQNMHDLLPLPLTEEVIHHVVERVKIVQDYLGCQILLENPSTYLSFQCDTLPEQVVMNQIAREADSLILLDINNVYVSACNHGFDPIDYLKELPADRIRQIHLAGHTHYEHYIIDTHDAPVIDPVWRLYQTAVRYFGLIPTMIERDDNIPPIDDLIQELNQARHISQVVLEKENITELA